MSKSNSTASWSPEEKEANRRFRFGIYIALIFSGSLIFLVSWYVLQGDLDLAPNVIASDLSGFSEKFEFTLQYAILGLIWLAFSLWNVMSKSHSSASEGSLQAARNILTNSMEQFLISLTCQLGLAAYLDGEMTRRVIPLMSFLYLFGRICFFIGYPKYRAFGFQITILPPQIGAWVLLSYFLESIWGISGLFLTILTWGSPLIFHFLFHLQVTKHLDKKFD